MTLKPLLLIGTAIAGTTLALNALGPAEGIAENSRYSIALATDRIWVKLKQETNLEEIAAQLVVDQQQLADLNRGNAGPIMKAGQWIVLPNAAETSVSASELFAGAEIRHTAPLQSPPPAQAIATASLLTPPPAVPARSVPARAVPARAKETAQGTVKVKFGETGASIAKMHGLSEVKFKDLNPDIDLAKLKVGSNVRVLAMRPGISGGISWPHLPSLPNGTHPALQFGSDDFIWPTKGVTTSGFGWRWGRMHQGIDIANNVGTPVLAAKNGIVSYSGWQGAYGYLVEIAHVDGTVTRYAHNSQLLVRKGQLIPQGANISRMGSTGRSTGPHLHFEIRRPGGSATDPMRMLPRKRA